MEDLALLAHTVDGRGIFVEDLDSRWFRLLCHTADLERSRRSDVAEIQSKGKHSSIPPAWHHPDAPRD